MTETKQDTAQPRHRLRPLLLFILLLAITALVVQRPALRQDAAASVRRVVMYTLGLSPRDWYALRLRVAGLDDSVIGQRWLHAIDRAARSARPIKAGLRTRAGFAAQQIDAHVYSLRLKRGQQLLVRLGRNQPHDGRLFANLKRLEPKGQWRLVEHLPADGRVSRIVISRTGGYRIELQPELAAAVSYRLAVARGGSLRLPVVGATRKDIGSGFGAPRAGGQRKHHGIDIFADRGTPVVAVADGRVSLGRQGIGGNHVWLSSGLAGWAGKRYYYAHLASFTVADGQRVRAGDIIGRVGHTGNARTTPAHLHFGIYTRTGPVDPAPFVAPPPRLGEPVAR